MFSYVLILGGGLFSWWECGRHRLRVWCFFSPPWSYRCCRLGSNKMLSQEFVCSADSWWWKSASLFHQRDWGEIAVMYCPTGSWIFLSKTLSAFPLPISASACLIIQGEGKIGRLVFFFFYLNTNTAELIHPNHYCPLPCFFLEETKCLSECCGYPQTEKGFAVPPLLQLLSAYSFENPPC